MYVICTRGKQLGKEAVWGGGEKKNLLGDIRNKRTVPCHTRHKKFVGKRNEKKKTLISSFKVWFTCESCIFEMKLDTRLRLGL